MCARFSCSSFGRLRASECLLCSSRRVGEREKSLLDSLRGNIRSRRICSSFVGTRTDGRASCWWSHVLGESERCSRWAIVGWISRREQRASGHGRERDDRTGNGETRADCFAGCSTTICCSSEGDRDILRCSVAECRLFSPRKEISARFSPDERNDSHLRRVVQFSSSYFLYLIMIQYIHVD